MELMNENANAAEQRRVMGDVKLHMDIRPANDERFSKTLVLWTNLHGFRDLLYMVDYEEGAFEVALGRGLQEIGKQIAERAVDINKRKMK